MGLKTNCEQFQSQENAAAPINTIQGMARNTVEPVGVDDETCRGDRCSFLFYSWGEWSTNHLWSATRAIRHSVACLIEDRDKDALAEDVIYEV
jgi:hypothetical protein